jgi:PAS domain S-box-containing protein
MLCGWIRKVQGVLAQPAAAWVLLGIGLLAILLASLGARRQAALRDEARFLARTDALRAAIAQEFDRHVRVLSSARALWAIHPPRDHGEWRDYVQSLGLADSFRGLHALGYVERVPAAQLPGFVERVRREESGHPEWRGFQVHPPHASEERYVVRFIEPLESNRAALGYDIGSEANRRQAAEEARDSGQVALTHGITLVQAPQAPGVLLMLPLYASGPSAASAGRGRPGLLGWVYTVIVVESLLGVVQGPGSEYVEVEVFDGAPGSTAARLLAGGRPSPAPGVEPSRPAFERLAHMSFGKTVWTLRFRAGPGFAQTRWYSSPGYVSAAGLGLCITVLVFGVARSQADLRGRAQALADEMTTQVRLQNDAMASAKNGIFILDATRGNCPVVYANPSFERMTGFSLEGALPEGGQPRVRDGAVCEPVPDMRALLAAGGGERPVLREYQRGGQRSWVEFRLLSVLNAEGQPTRFLGIAEDVTARRQAEEQLAVAQQRYRELVDNLGVGVYRNTSGEQGRFVEVNPALLAMFEAASKEELTGHPTRKFFLDAGQRRALGRKITREGFVKEEEVRLRTLRGRPFWAAVTAVMKTDAGGAAFFDGIVEDITHRKEAEQALRESQERFALAVQGTNDGIWDWNVATNTVYFSPRWKEMLGYEEQEVENSLAGWERLLHPEDRARALEAIRAYFAGETPSYELEHRLRHKDGSYRWILARGVVIRDAAGRPSRMAGSHVDLTARKEAEQQLRQANQELARSQAELRETLRQLQASHSELQQAQLQLIQAAKLESVGSLAAGVAHEVKNPLQTILMGVGYLSNRRPPPDADAAQALDDMREAVQRANRIIRELLELSAATEFELKEEDLNEVIVRSLWLLNHEFVAARLQVVRQLQRPLDPVAMDRNKIEQVLLNLLLNAVQAMSAGGTLTVTTRSGCVGQDLALRGGGVSGVQPGERWVIAEVHDTGPGIPRAQLERVFEPFFTTKPVGVGTGLGLSVAKKIVDLHDGTIDIRNAAEGGTRVTLAFRAQPRRSL